MNKIIFLFAALLVTSGCRKYVEIEQIGKRTLTYTKDYRALLDANSQLEGGFSLPIYSGDDTRITDVSKQNAMADINANAYTWAAKYWSDSQSDSDWEKLYRVIYTCNEALAGVMDSKDGTEVDKQQLYAEALVHRAYAYWCLVNIYGRQYDAATASTDLGVPLLRTPDLFAKLNRATVADVYKQIISDLKQSLDPLPALPDYNTRPSKSAVYALLARTYLMMGSFTDARTFSEQALALKGNLLDFSSFASGAVVFPYRINDPEIIFSKVNIPASVYTGIQLDPGLLALLGTNDMRYKLFVRPGASFQPIFTGFGYWKYKYSQDFNVISQSLSVPEMMLIKAECLARNNDGAGAITILNNLRIKRFETANYVALTPLDAPNALRLVVDERKREFFGTGLRWFDQKRLNKDAAFAATVTRVFKGVTYTLEPNSDRYVYPIGDKYILLNPELQQNPR